MLNYWDKRKFNKQITNVIFFKVIIASGGLLQLLAPGIKKPFYATAGEEDILKVKLTDN